jgi:hypothetical protein
MTRRSDFTMIVTGAKQPASSSLLEKLITGSKKISEMGSHILNRLNDLNGLNVLNGFFSRRLRDERAQDHAYKAEHDGAEESGPEAGNGKTRYEI